MLLFPIECPEPVPLFQGIFYEMGKGEKHIFTGFDGIVKYDDCAGFEAGSGIDEALLRADCMVVIHRK